MRVSSAREGHLTVQSLGAERGRTRRMRNMNDVGKLKLREKVAYGFGDLASVLYWQTFMAYLMLYYTDVFGISAAAVATMFLVSRLWDGVNDPMMGMLADRTETRWGKFRPYLLWICVPFAVVGVLTFTTPGLGPTGKLVWAYVTFVLLMMLYTAINIPYTAMLGVLTPNPNERTSLSAVKFLFAFGAGVIVSATLLPMTKALGAGSAARGWSLSFMIYGAAAILFFLITFAGTRERVRPPRTQKTTIQQDIRDLVSNRPWVILLLTTITFILFVATRMSATAHYFKYYIGEQTLKLPFVAEATYSFETLVSAYNTIGQVAAIAGVLLVSWFARQVGKKRAFVILFVISIFATAAFYFFEPSQLLPIFALQVVGSITGGPLSVLIWAMYADAADYAEWKQGRRATGLVFSASTMSQKMGWAIGSAVAGWILSAVGFQPNVDQTDEVRHGLLLLVSLIPAALGVRAVVVVLFYPLSDAKVAEIERELRQRRAASGEDAGEAVAPA